MDVEKLFSIGTLYCGDCSRPLTERNRAGELICRTYTCEGTTVELRIQWPSGRAMRDMVVCRIDQALGGE